jgi:hypothetical protein
MTRRATTWRRWGGLSILGAISVTLAVGWWMDHRLLSREADAMKSQVEYLQAQPSPEALRAQNDDLIRFIDESYSLLKAEGFHVQLDLAVDRDGHYRLRADSVKLMEDLRVKLQELKEIPGKASAD